MKSTGYYRLSLVCLAYTIPVILFGAFVRATISGDGCGVHWPTCQGELFPPDGNVAALVEFTHRVTSGILLPLIIALVIGAFRLFERGSPVRRSAVAALGFVLLEAAIGAKLVLFGWVARDDSAQRVVAMSVHLVNTFMLLSALALTVHYAAGGVRPRWRGQGGVAIALAIAIGGLILLGASGAVTALGDTLYPVSRVVDGLQAEPSATAHFLQRLRILHPVIATSVGLFVLLAAGLIAHLRPSQEVRTRARWLVAGYMAQMVLGVINVLLFAPIWMQLLHLFVSDLIWIGLVMLSVAALNAEPREQAVASEPDPSPRLSARQLIREYVALTKPRVVSLLLFTTFAAMIVAAQGWPGGWLVLAVMLGGYMSAGAANAFNMALERDLDEAMDRTSTRPTVTHSLSTRNVVLFGVALTLGSFGLLTWAANLLTASLAFAGLVFYVVVYTLMLKRRTWQNIVIGGAAGAFPPLVGYASVSGSLSPLAWYLFAIIVTWTPVHFWALAILLKDDYARAGVPMLPVVRGERATVIQIGLYALLTAVVTLMPMLQGQVGYLYFSVAVLLNIGLLIKTGQLFMHTDRPHAKALFKYSMTYLALLFLVVALDRVRWS